MRLSRYGGDCYAYCMLAAGHVDLVIETELKPYDIVAADPDHHRRRRHHHRLGRRPGRPAAAASSPPATRACTKRRWKILERLIKRKQRRARHERVERRPELRAVAVLLHHQFVLGAGDDEMRAGAQPQPRSPRSPRSRRSRRGRRRPAPSAGADCDVKRGSANSIHGVEGRRRPADGRRAEPERGLRFQHRLGARMPHRIGGRADCR